MPVEASPEASPRGGPDAGSKGASVARSAAPADTLYGFTHGRATGNRVVAGEGRLPDAAPVDVDLSGTPVWVAGAPLDEDTAWVVTYNDGRVDAFLLDGDSGEIMPWLTAPDRLRGGAPPALVVAEGRLGLLTLKGVSPLTHPVRAGAGLLGVAPEGRLVSDAGGVPPISAPPDARVVEAEDGTLAVLSDPTTRYAHGVLGDGIEAGA